MAERVFTEMDHERFTKHMDLQFVSIKKSMDGFIRSAFNGTAKRFIMSETENDFKAKKNVDIDTFIDDVMKEIDREWLQ